MKDNKSGCLGVTLFLLLCGSLLGNLALGVIALTKIGDGASVASIRSGKQPHFAEETIVSGSADSKIVQIDLRGIISSNENGGVLGETMVEDMKLACRQAALDDSVAAIVLHIDSPGGEVTASDIIYQAVRELNAKKPVVVHMGSVAASGGYYVACGGSHLMATPTTITGSIGVIISTLNYKDLLGKVGLDSVVFKSGKFKDILSGSRDMTPEEIEYVQGLVMETYDRFVRIVADARGVKKEALVTGVADGRIVSGQSALAEKLIDSVGYIEDAYAKAMELAGVEDAPVVRYTVSVNFGKILRLLGESDARVEVDLLGGRLPKLEGGKMYYLPGTFAP